jgi:hypothetical protein
MRRSAAIGLRKPHLWYSGGRYRPWTCRAPVTGAVGTGWNPAQAYFQMYWNDAFGRLGTGLLPPPWTAPV